MLRSVPDDVTVSRVCIMVHMIQLYMLYYSILSVPIVSVVLTSLRRVLVVVCVTGWSPRTEVHGELPVTLTLLLAVLAVTAKEQLVTCVYRLTS